MSFMQPNPLWLLVPLGARHPMPRIMPEARYFSIPSTVVGAVAFKNEALNWTPRVRSLIQVPLAWTIHQPRS
jgi:hypothetical protein